ncbi:MAG: M56 family metallopeptidase [Clostridiales bacterium]|nr:M56 family metallopeptidase [Clostridiales bacterium]
MTNLMLQLLELTVSMSVLITFILLFFKLFGKKFTSKCKYIVWTIVILRLCLPVGIFSAAPLFEIKVPNIRNTSVNTADTVGDSEISIPNTPSEKLPSNNISGTISPDNNMQTPTVNPDITPKTPSFESDTPVLPNNKADNSTTTENIHTEFMPSENETEKKITHIPSIEIIPALLCSVWAAGAVLFIGARLIPYAVYVRRMKKVGLLHAPSEEAGAVYEALCRKIGVKRPPKLLVSRVPVSPHLCGFIRRKVIIPDMTYAMNDIESILSHELTHFKRGDLYVKLACTAAQAVSWFNPLVHLASGKCISEMELSCDESVLKNSNEEERILYGNAMLDIVRRCGHVKGSYLTSDFRPKHGAVKERIMNIINSEKKKKGIGIIAIALALCITAGTIIGCNVAAKRNDDTQATTSIPWKDENTSETGNFIGINVSDETSLRENWYHEKNVNPKESELVEAFLTNDTVTLGIIIPSTMGAFERSYADMKIGEYRIVFDPEDKEKYENLDNDMSALKVDVEILESKNEILTPGIHRLVPSFTKDGTSFVIENENKNTHDTDRFTTTDKADCLAAALLNQNITSMDDIRNIAASADTQDITALVLGCIKYYTDIDKLNEKLSYSSIPGFSEEEIAECAEKYFDTSNLVPVSGTPEEMDDFKYILSEDGLYRMRKGLNPENNVLSTCESNEVDGTVTTNVTVWADLSETIKSSKYEYKFELSDGNPKLIDAKLVEDSAFLPLELRNNYSFSEIELYQFAEAFINRDISECARLYYGNHSVEESPELESTFAPLSTLEFSSHKIYREFDESLYETVKMKFTVSQSGYDSFPVGDYEAELYYGPPQMLGWKLKKPDDITLSEEEQAAVDFITPLFPYMKSEDKELARQGMTLQIFLELGKISDKPAYEIKATSEEMKKAAFELYSTDDFEPHELEAQFLDEEYYTIAGHCGYTSFQRIKNITKADNFYFIDVQYFDDTLYFTPTNTVRYTVAETDSRFGYRLQAAEVIDGFKEEASPIFLPYQLQAYEGVWRIDNREDTTLTINKVNTETGFASLRFSFVLSRSFSINTTAGLISGYYYFNDTENSGIQGRIRFYEKEIILIFDSFGSLPGYVGGWGSVYRFNTKDNDWVMQNRVIPDSIPEFVQGNMKVYSPEDALKYIPYNFTFLPTYRDIYFCSRHFF